jgi:hypothetical protein
MGLDTKTYWLTDRKSQCDFDLSLVEIEEASTWQMSSLWLTSSD